LIKKLAADDLKRVIDPESLGFATTAELKGGAGMIGQERAVNALRFGLNARIKGYNVYVCGLPGSGRTTFAKAFAEEAAAGLPVPDDLCYVYNFKNPQSPLAISLPAGLGRVFAQDMDELVENLTEELRKSINGKEFDNRRSDIVRDFNAKREEIIRFMTIEAKKQNFGVKTTNSGIYFLPIIDGELLSEEQYDALSQEKRGEIFANSDEIQKQASDAMRAIKDHERDMRVKIDELEYTTALFNVGRHIGELCEAYADHPQILTYLGDVKEDILDNIGDFSEVEEAEEEVSVMLPWYNKRGGENTLDRYKVNVFTDNGGLERAPVVVDFNPTYFNLVGEVEYDNEYGSYITDFMKIKPGLLHKANGGFLILQAGDLLASHHAWETLRRVLVTGEIVMEPLREYATGLAVSRIKPQPAKVDVKVVLVGNDWYYELLSEYDEAFPKLFKILADFDSEMDCTDDNVRNMAEHVKDFVIARGSLEFDAPAVARVIEYSLREAERKDKLTTRLSLVEDVLAESQVWAKLDGAGVIAVKHVAKAIADHDHRLSMYDEKLTELINKGIIMLDCDGRKIGQINGLAVMETFGYAFAKPSKITATTYVGKAGVINIEKEADMSGSIHEKGIQVIVGYMGQTYAQEFPLSLSARVCFEQNYNGVDGDSASSTELYAILSSLAELPIYQGLAVTGSINQRGEIQPIGGVSLKIEGFFALCKSRGLTGSQGVIIPVQNVGDLTLDDEVIEAVRAGLFHIYAITHADDGIELLTGAPAGVKNEKGKYPPDSVHGRVFKKLKDFNKRSSQE